MNILAVIDHPWKESFNYAVLDAFVSGAENAGHTVNVVDLNAIGFNPVMSPAELAVYSTGGSHDPVVREHQDLIMQSQHLAFVYPVWWSVMPARLKGWFDKVLLPGFAFTPGDVPEPLLTHIPAATVLTTTGAPDDLHRTLYGEPTQRVVCEGTLAFCGIASAEWLNFGLAGIAPREDHEAWLRKVREYARGL
ncbi:MAG: NAD(P)H-dependent oxidoreductase [Spirochaetaceae bacterium]